MYFFHSRNIKYRSIFTVCVLGAVATLVISNVLSSAQADASLAEPSHSNYIKRVYKKGDRIAVIGAGVCGLAVVRSLVEEGVDPHSIQVIEKEPSAGGKVQSIQVEGRPYELGAQVIVPEVYEPIFKLVKKYHLSLRKQNTGGDFDLESGRYIPQTSSNGMLDFGKALAKYEWLWSSSWKSISEPKGLENVPANLRMSWPEMVKQQGLEAIHIRTSGFIGGSGYLSENALPQAAQMVRMLTPGNLINLAMHGTRIFNGGGYQQLWKLEAADLEKLGVSFRYNTTVTAITRMSETTLIDTSEEAAPIAVEHVFYTANLAYLPKLLRDARDSEKELFGRVVNNDYRSYLVNIEGLSNQGKSGSFGFLPYTVTGAPKHVVLSVKPYSDSSYHVLYAYGTPTTSDDEIIANMNADLNRIGARITKVIAKKKWDYFPHVSSDLQDFFRDVMSFEGSGGVWIAGEATSFTATIEVYKQGRDFAKLFVKNQL